MEWDLVEFLLDCYLVLVIGEPKNLLPSTSSLKSSSNSSHQQQQQQQNVVNGFGVVLKPISDLPKQVIILLIRSLSTHILVQVTRLFTYSLSYRFY